MPTSWQPPTCLLFVGRCSRLQLRSLLGAVSSTIAAAQLLLHAPLTQHSLQVATLLLLGSNRHRCTLALQQCPAAGPWVVKAAGLLQRLSIFSGVLVGQGLVRPAWQGSTPRCSTAGQTLPDRCIASC